MNVFGLLHVVYGNHQRGPRQPPQLSPIEPAKPYGVRPAAVCEFDRSQHVGRIPTRGYPDHQVCGAKEIFQRFDENLLVGNIIGIGHQSGHVVVQADYPETFFKAERNALVDVAREVGSGRTTTAISHDENLALLVESVLQQPHEFFEGLKRHGVECPFESFTIVRKISADHTLPPTRYPITAGPILAPFNGHPTRCWNPKVFTQDWFATRDAAPPHPSHRFDLARPPSYTRIALRQGESQVMKVVVVGGHSRNIGKTSVMVSLIRGLESLAWTAVKITQYG